MKHACRAQVFEPPEEFRVAMIEAGLLPGDVTPDGLLRRCPTKQHPKSKNGWYVLYSDPPAGAFGDWATDLSETWSYHGEPLPEKDRARLRVEIQKQRAKREALQAEARKAAIGKARHYLKGLAPATEENPYLIKKGVKPCSGLRADGADLVVPVIGSDGPISYQLIAPKGGKKFASGCPVAGGYFAIRGNDGPLLVAEGLATGLSLHGATGLTVLCAFSAGNLEAVARTARDWCAERRIIVCADNDNKTEARTGTNPGIKAATDAARAVDGLLAIPQQGGDWNDVHQQWGLEAVKKGVETARPEESSRAANDWPAVVSFDNTEAPAIPEDAVPEPLRSFCNEISESIQVPFDLGVIAAIGTVAAVAQGKYQIKVRDGYVEPLSLYLLGCLPPGERKSAVLASCKSPVIEWESEQAKRIGPELKRLRSERSTREKTIEKMRSKATPENLDKVVSTIQKMEEELPEVPEVPRLLADDVTSEALAAFMAQHDERAAILEAEGGIFEILSGLYTNGKANLNLLLKAWSGEPVAVDRRSRDTLRLSKPALTLALIVQPEVLRDIASKPGFRGKGVLGRFLYCLPKSRLGGRTAEPRSIRETIVAKYRSMIMTILETGPSFWESGELCAYTLKLSSGAYRRWIDFVNGVEAELRDGGSFETIRDWAGKLPGQAVRLAGVYHVASEPDPTVLISENIMNKALKLAAVLSENALVAFGSMGSDPSIECARRIWKWVEDTRPEKFTARDAHQAVKGSYPKAEMISVGLRVLQDRAYIRQIANSEKHGPGRKPSPVFEINPLAHNSHNSHNS